MALIVNIEGIDGSGKGTQASRLLERLLDAGRTATKISFPRYTETSYGRKVADFLNGKFGQLSQVHPCLASLLYAGDRFESKHWLECQTATHEVVILDRYVASNMAHQGSKLEGTERSELIDWVERVEFGINGLPRPDICLLLDIPPAHAQSLIALKAPREYTDSAADIQEADTEHLQRTREAYLELARSRSHWVIIKCLTQDSMRSADEIAAEVWNHVWPRIDRF